MVTIAIGVFIINYFILYFASSSTIAGYGAAVRTEQLALLPAFALNISVLINWSAVFMEKSSLNS